MYPGKTLQKILDGSTNIRFADFKALIEAHGFHLSRISGSHHIFSHPDIRELINIQNVKGKAKSYQIKQALRLFERYNLRLGEPS